jgi:hypothetical protein
MPKSLGSSLAAVASIWCRNRSSLAEEIKTDFAAYDALLASRIHAPLHRYAVAQVITFASVPLFAVTMPANGLAWVWAGGEFAACGIFFWLSLLLLCDRIRKLERETAMAANSVNIRITNACREISNDLDTTEANKVAVATHNFEAVMKVCADIERNVVYGEPFDRKRQRHFFLAALCIGALPAVLFLQARLVGLAFVHAEWPDTMLFNLAGLGAAWFAACLFWIGKFTVHVAKVKKVKEPLEFPADSNASDLQNGVAEFLVKSYAAGGERHGDAVIERPKSCIDIRAVVATKVRIFAETAVLLRYLKMNSEFPTEDMKITRKGM